MNYGLYLSANGISSAQHRMNVLSNNLANANTVGFKPSEVVLGERAREERASWHVGAEDETDTDSSGAAAFA